MGAFQNVVRRITVVGKTEGVDQAATQLRGLSAAQDGVAVSSEREGQAHLSVQSKLNGLMRTLDAEYRSEQKLEAIQRTLTAARNQGLVSIARENELMGLATAKYKVAGEAAEGYGEKVKLAKELAFGFVSGIGAGVLLGGLTELPAAIAETVEKLSKIGDTAETIGITTKALQELQFAASSVDVPVTTLDSAMETFSKNLAKAQSQGGALSKIFGLNGVKITGDTFTDLEHYADLVKNATNQEQRNLLITTAFGKGAADLGPMFRDGAAGIEEWARQADDAGIHTDAQIQRAHDLNQELTALKPALVDAQEDFAVMIAPAEIATLQGFNDALRQTRDLLSDIQNLDLKKVASVIGRDEGDHWSLFGKNGVVPNFLQSITSPTYGQMFPNGPPPLQITVNGGAPPQLGTAAETYDFATFFKSLNTPTKTGNAGDEAALAAAAAESKKRFDELQRGLHVVGESTVDLANKAKQFAQDLDDTIGGAFASVLDGPVTDFADGLDRVLGGLGSYGQQSLNTSLSKILQDSTSKGIGEGLSDWMKQKSDATGYASAAVSGVGLGYQAQNPLTGALGGVLAGAAGGPLAMVVGPVTGTIGNPLTLERTAA